MHGVELSATNQIVEWWRRHSGYTFLARTFT
jgi:hypothetical protein